MTVASTPSSIDPQDTMFVIGAAVFTTFLSEGTSLLSSQRFHSLNRNFLVHDIQTPRVQETSSKH